jgi:hypothetical protein
MQNKEEDHYSPIKEILKTLSDIWNPKKEYLDEELWVIRNFLSKEEVEYILSEINKPEHWYLTMRSPYKNILNKFLDVKPRYNEDGILVSQFDNDSEKIDMPIFHSDYGIDNRLKSVLPKYFFTTAASVQTFLSVKEEDEEMVKMSKQAKEENFSMDWHYEAPNEDFAVNRTGAFSIYLNDDFVGGELLFIHKPDIVIKPEPGMLVCVPLGENYMHKVSFVSNGDRHTLYGSCFSNSNFFTSSIEDC